MSMGRRLNLDWETLTLARGTQMSRCGDAYPRVPLQFKYCLNLPAGCASATVGKKQYHS